MSQNKKGFTIVEVLIVMPIVIIVIGVFITAIVNMTGDVLATRGANSLIYNIHNALNQIEQDIKLSDGFLETNSFILTAPQGSDDATNTPFLNITASGPALILDSLATTSNPLNTARNIVYENNPKTCIDVQVDQNNPVKTNIVYFIKNRTLWRRTIMPSGYTAAGYGCDAIAQANATIWQQASCAPTVPCPAKDMKLVDDIVPGSGFKIDYYTSPESTTPDIIANSLESDITERHTALQAISTATITINSTLTVAGRDVNQSGIVRVSLPK